MEPLCGDKYRVDHDNLTMAGKAVRPRAHDVPSVKSSDSANSCQVVSSSGSLQKKAQRSTGGSRARQQALKLLRGGSIEFQTEQV